MASLMGDIGSLLGAGSAGNIAQNSTSRKGNTELNMDDFLQLMIVQLTNQTIDDTMDTGEMMNQFLQMQMISTMANMNEISIQSYANSLVGKKVTIGVVNGNVLEERELFVYGTGTYNGQQVIFCEDGNMYFLSQIMAVGVLPDENGNYTIGGGSGDTSGSDGVDAPYECEVNGETKTAYAGADGIIGTEDDWYAVDVDGDGEEDTFVFAGEDKKFGTEDDWYYAVDSEGVTRKYFVGEDGKPGTEYDYEDPEYDGSLGADSDND